MYSWFETRIDPYPDRAPERPPDTLGAFYRYFILPVWPVFVVLLVVGFLGSVIEVALAAFIGSIVDLMRTSGSPQTFLPDSEQQILLGWRNAKRIELTFYKIDLTRDAIMTSLLLSLVALTAIYLPARRVIRLEPAMALRRH